MQVKYGRDSARQYAKSVYRSYYDITFIVTPHHSPTHLDSHSYIITASRFYSLQALVELSHAYIHLLQKMSEKTDLCESSFEAKWTT